MLLLLLSLAILSVFQTALPGVDAKCCRQLAQSRWCGGGGEPTPCCGYGKCNSACCACTGETVVRQLVRNRDPGVEYLLYYTTLTAPPGKTWTCQANHLTSTNFHIPADAVSVGQITERGMAAAVTPMPYPIIPTSVAPPLYGPEMLADLQRTFDSMGAGHNGTGVVTLDDYFEYFNVSRSGRDTDYGKSVEAKFRIHDINGDGVMTIDEAQLRCDSDGCE